MQEKKKTHDLVTQFNTTGIRLGAEPREINLLKEGKNEDYNTHSPSHTWVSP